jgi:hypothetical protein
MYQTYPLPPKVQKKKSFWNVRRIWKLRYRVYALIVIIVLAPILYSSEKNVPENVTVNGLGYEITQQNFLADKIERSDFGNLFGEDVSINSEQVKPTTIIVDGEKVIFYDKNGQIITEILKGAGIDLGFIYSQPFLDIGFQPNISAEQLEGIENKLSQNEGQKNVSLDDLIPRPSQPGRFRDLLVYDKYKIVAPVVYATLDDLFEKKPDGTLDFTKARATDSFDSPVQKKLEQGIVHLGYSPVPGELGNSYIVGHSSNYSFIKSPYNTVFKPIEQKSQPGEEFVIYDRYGRELKFRVFEAVKIADNDVQTAYARYPDRRVVTLQTSILGIRNGKWEATHRWLTRGELILP